MLIDVHLHSDFSFDSSEKVENYVERAQAAGVPVIGFSEHYDYDAVLDGADISVADIPNYVAELRRLRAKYESPEILCGIEFGYRDVSVEKYRELIADYDFDYVINSVHTLAGRGDCFHDEFFAGKSLKESYSDYLKTVYKSVKSDFDFQIIGHIGYVSRYRKGDGARLSYGDFSDILDEILREIIRRDKCLEINTSVGSSGSSFLPDTDIIKRYLQLGGKLISYGSDAHEVKNYQRNSEKLCEFLKSQGVSEFFYYKNRRPVGYKI